MISTQQLLYKLDLRLNKKASNEHQSIPLEDKILALREATIKLVKLKVDPNNIYNAGLDSFKKRYTDLQPLVVSFEGLNVNKTTEVYNSYEADITTTLEKYFLPLDAYALCTKGNCTEHLVEIPKEIKHGDISTYINNTHYSPSFEYQTTFAVISDNKFIIYTDGTFTVDKLHLSYLKYPKLIDSEGYINFDGTASIDQDTDLPDYLEDELLNIATLDLAMDTENVPAVQFSDIRNKTNE